MTKKPLQPKSLQRARVRTEKLKPHVIPSQKTGVAALPEQSSTTDDPILGALLVHEAEIERLHAVILELRGAQVKSPDANIGQKPRSRVEAMSEMQVQFHDEQITSLTTALHEAWAELETKQAHLQTAVDDNKELQQATEAVMAQMADAVAQRDAVQSALANAGTQISSLDQEIDVLNKRLGVALDMIARRNYSVS